MTDSITIKRFTGQDPELQRYLPDLARLRIEVFRDFPYLYDGSYEYEEKYLKTYTQSPESVIVLVLDGEKVVGATTGIPMEHETEEFQKPFLEHGYDPKKIFYCGESVLLKDYRGRGFIPSSSKNEKATHGLSAASIGAASAACNVRRTTRAVRRITCRSIGSGANSAMSSIRN